MREPPDPAIMSQLGSDYVVRAWAVAEGHNMDVSGSRKAACIQRKLPVALHGKAHEDETCMGGFGMPTILHWNPQAERGRAAQATLRHSRLA